MTLSHIQSFAEGLGKKILYSISAFVALFSIQFSLSFHAIMMVSGLAGGLVGWVLWPINLVRYLIRNPLEASILNIYDLLG